MNEQRELDKIADELKKYSHSQKENKLKENLEQQQQEIRQTLNQIERDLMIIGKIWKQTRISN